MFQIKSLHLESNRHSGSYCDLNPSCYWDLPTSDVEHVKHQKTSAKFNVVFFNRWWFHADEEEKKN